MPCLSALHLLSLPRTLGPPPGVVERFLSLSPCGLAGGCPAGEWPAGSGSERVLSEDKSYPSPSVHVPNLALSFFQGWPVVEPPVSWLTLGCLEYFFQCGSETFFFSCGLKRHTYYFLKKNFLNSLLRTNHMGHLSEISFCWFDSSQLTP